MFELERLPLPDMMGHFFHPDIPGENEEDDVRQMCKDMGFEVTGVYMEDDNPALYEAWECGDDYASLVWRPFIPWWTIVAKSECEDGPCAMFVRPLY